MLSTAAPASLHARARLWASTPPPLAYASLPDGPSHATHPDGPAEPTRRARRDEWRQAAAAHAAALHVAAAGQLAAVAEFDAVPAAREHPLPSPPPPDGICCPPGCRSFTSLTEKVPGMS